jgi:anthranilate phosphoribosyltransferase
VNRLSHWHNGRVTTRELDPLDLDLPRATLDNFVGGEPEENAQITHDILSGKDKGPRCDIVLLNAAAALSMARNDWAAGLAEARESIDSGAALNTLERWIYKTNHV